MNILFFHKNGINPLAGGISKITTAQKELFRRHGHYVAMLACRPAKNLDYIYDNEQYFLPTQSLMNPADVEYAENLINTKHIDVVINQSALDYAADAFCFKLKQNTGIRLISCMHNALLTPIKNYAYQKEWNWTKSWKKILFQIMKTDITSKLLVQYYIWSKRSQLKKIVIHSDATVVLCNGMKVELERICGHNTCKKIRVIPNFHDGSSNSDVNLIKENLVLWIGTIDFAVKRIDFMLDVWKLVQEKIANWQLAILGDGSGLAQAKKYSAELGLNNVVFTGRVNPEEYLKKAKIVCVTSSHESFSLVSIEALAYGAYPIVNNSYPAAQEIIEDGKTGDLVKPFSRIEYAKALMAEIKDWERHPKDQSVLVAASKRYTGDAIYPEWDKLMTAQL